LGLSTYVGRFNDVDATLNFSPEQMTKSSLQAKVSIASLDVDNDSLEQLLAESAWFDTGQFPEASIETIEVAALESNNEFLFKANLTLKGVTKPIMIKAKFHGGADNWLTGRYTLGFSASFSFNRSEFNMDSYIPMVGDKVDVEVYAEFLRRD
jgi:polyisoprenoid-binding protein YceI